MPSPAELFAQMQEVLGTPYASPILEHTQPGFRRSPTTSEETFAWYKSVSTILKLFIDFDTQNAHFEEARELARGTLNTWRLIPRISAPPHATWQQCFSYLKAYLSESIAQFYELISKHPATPDIVRALPPSEETTNIYLLPDFILKHSLHPENRIFQAFNAKFMGLYLLIKSLQFSGVTPLEERHHEKMTMALLIFYDADIHTFREELLPRLLTEENPRAFKVAQWQEDGCLAIPPAEETYPERVRFFQAKARRETSPAAHTSTPEDDEVATILGGLVAEDTPPASEASQSACRLNPDAPPFIPSQARGSILRVSIDSDGGRALLMDAIETALRGGAVDAEKENQPASVNTTRDSHSLFQKPLPLETAEIMLTASRALRSRCG